MQHAAGAVILGRDLLPTLPPTLQLFKHEGPQRRSWLRLFWDALLFLDYFRDVDFWAAKAVRLCFVVNRFIVHLDVNQIGADAGKAMRFFHPKGSHRPEHMFTRSHGPHPPARG